MNAKKWVDKAGPVKIETLYERFHSTTIKLNVLT